MDYKTEIDCEDACYSKGIKETEQTDSSQSKPDVSGCEKESIGIAETMEQNHNLSMCSSNNEFSLNGANDDASVVTPKIENNADDEIAATAAAVSSNNTTNGSSTLATTVCSASLTSEKSDKSELSLSEVNCEDSNMKSIEETTGKSTKMDNDTFTDDTSAQILLPEEEESEEEAKPTGESGESLDEIDRKSLQNQNQVKCVFVGAESESIENPINASLLVHKNADEEINVDTKKVDSEINENKTEVETFLQGGGAEADASDKKNSPGNAKHEHGSGIDLKKEKPEDLMDENVDVARAETNSFEPTDVPISANAKSESHVFMLEELKFEDVLKNGRSKGLELAPDGEDQMDGDQGSVEIDFMLGDGDEHEQAPAQGDEIDSDEEEDNSELLVEGHDTSTEFHLHQLSEKVGLQAIEENTGQPIEFKVKGSEEDVESEQLSNINSTENADSEILSSDIHDKLLTGGCEQEKSTIYSEAAAASKLETVSGEGQLSKSTAAVLEEQARRVSLESRPLIPMETSVKEDKLLYSEKEITPSVDQWTPSPFTSEVLDSHHESSRKEGIPEMLQYRKPTRPQVSAELDGKKHETMQIELLEEEKEEINVEADSAFKSETENADTSVVEVEAKSTPLDQRTEEENQSELEGDEERSGKSSSDVITEQGFVETEENDALKQTSIIPSRKLEKDSDLLVEEIKDTEKEKALNENGKTAPCNEKLEIIASKQSLLQQESVKKMHLPVKSVTTATAAKKSASRGKILGKKEADNDSGVDETTQAKVETKKNVPTTLKGIPRKQQVIASPTKRLPSPTKALTSPTKQMASARTPLSPSGMKFNGKTPTLEQKSKLALKQNVSNSQVEPPNHHPSELPMNKIVVGQAASPNLKQVKSKIGSMTNMTHRPGGGTVRVESKQLNFSQAKSKVGAVNANYKPGGGDKKIESKKLEWNAKSKVGSLDNSNHKPGGGEKKIESMKLDFKDKATSKVGSVANLKHQPGGGKLQIEEHKLNFKDSAKSKVGSLDNVMHKPGGGAVVIYDDCRRPTSQSNSESQSPPQCVSPGLPQNGLTPTSIEGIPE